jgi:hypothetical protein
MSSSYWIPNPSLFAVRSAGMFFSSSSWTWRGSSISGIAISQTDCTCMREIGGVIDREMIPYIARRHTSVVSVERRRDVSAALRSSYSTDLEFRCSTALPPYLKSGPVGLLSQSGVFVFVGATVRAGAAGGNELPDMAPQSSDGI